MNKSEIKINNLEFGYNRKSLLKKPLTISAETGNLVVVAGKNGCGKSTLLKTLLGLHQPYSGEILLNDKDVNQYTYDEKAAYMAYADADRQIFGSFSVKEFLFFGRYPYLSNNLKISAEDEQIITQTVEYFGITHLLDKDIQTLSSGEYRLLQIVAAFVQDTPMVILDEPTANLDLDRAVEVFSKLNTLALESEKLIIVASHQINLAFRYATKILLFHNGEYFYETPQILSENKVMQQFFSNRSLFWDKNTMRFELKG